MNTIPPEAIDEVSSRFYGLSEDEARQAAQQAQEQQPFVFVYLLAMDESIFDEEDKGLLLELGGLVLQVMCAANPNLRQITDQELDAAEEANFKLLEDLDAGREMDYASSVKKLMQSYNQMPLLAAMLEALMAEHEHDPDFAPEHVGMALVALKTVIDCLDVA